jgi:hypothetical protein
MKKTIAIGLAAWTIAAATADPVVRLGAAPSCEVTGVSRVVAIGDVHGAADRLADILKAARLVDDAGHWSGGSAHLVQLGDVVDRGPDSRAAMDLLRRLEGEAERAGGAVHALLGNHEIARMLGDLRFATPGEYAAFTTPESDALRERFIQFAKPDVRDALSKELVPGSLELRSAFDGPGAYGEWLRRHDAVVKIDGVVFVHGGISPAIAAMACDEINARVRADLTVDFEKTRSAPLVSLAAREDGPFWYRGLAQLADADTATLEGILSAQHARAVVIAHTVTSNGRIQMRFGGRLFQTDTGMQPAYVQGGRASALEFAGAKVSAIYVDRRDQLIDSF